MEKLRKLERCHVRLQLSSHVLQTANREVVGGAKVVFVGMLVDAAIGSPGARWAPMPGVAIGGETPRLPHEAERGDGSPPLKPRRRIGFDVQFAFLCDSRSHRLLAHCIRSAGACGTERVVLRD